MRLYTNSGERVKKIDGLLGGSVLVDDFYDKAEIDEFLHGKGETTRITQLAVAQGYVNTANPDGLQNISITTYTPQSVPTIAEKNVYAGVYYVKEGERYKIYGKGDGTGLVLYTLVDANKQFAYKAPSIDYRESGIEITIPEGIVYLTVNFTYYDSEIDKIEKIEVLDAEFGICEKLDDLADTVGTYSDSISEINKELNGVDEVVITDMIDKSVVDKYWNCAGNPVGSTYTATSPGTFANCRTYKFNVYPGEIYKISGKSSSSAVALYMLTDANKVVQSRVDAKDARNNPVTVTVEKEGIIYINLSNYNAEYDYVKRETHNVKLGLREYVDSKVGNVEANKRKTIVVFGDSITERTDNMGNSWTDYLALKGYNVINVGIGGTRLGQRTTVVENPTTSMQGYAGLDIINMVKAACDQSFTITDNAAVWVKDNASDDNTKITDRLKEIDWSTVDAVVVFGGTNDWNNAGNLGTPSSTDFSSTLGAVNNIITMLATTYPTVKQYWVSPIVRWLGSAKADRTTDTWSDVVTNSEGKTLPDYVDEIGKLVTSYHYPYLDLYWTLGWNKINFYSFFNETDGTHPVKGFRQIADRIHEFISSGTTSKYK